jgi:hypothetical protein
MHEGLGFYASIVKNCTEFHEMTGQTSDVILLHTLMLHSALKSSLRIPRIITNPPISLKEPFNFNREDPHECSIVEMTLRELCADHLPGWTIKGDREMVVPERLRLQKQMKMELERRASGSRIGIV